MRRFQECWDWAYNTRTMKTKVFLGIVAAILFVLFCIYIFSPSHDDPTIEKPIDETVLPGVAPTLSNHMFTSTPKPIHYKIVICVVACGSQKYEEAMTMIKSALVFTKKHLKFIVFSDDKLMPLFNETLQKWQKLSNKTFIYDLKPITYPETVNENEWKKLFKLCASQRLFLPDLLNDTDSVLYMDTDTLFLTKPEKVWRVFSFMNSTQLAALAPEHEDPNTGWYNRFAKHPYYGKLGLNSGVMLMNLTRMREFRWTSYLAPIYKQYQHQITWGDQDIINILFHFHPERLFVYDCRFNYRADHCMYMPNCKAAEEHEGAIILHGSRGTFHTKIQPPFYAIYTVMSKYELGTETYYNLLFPMKNYLTQESDSSCSKSWRVFIVRPEMNLGKSTISKDYNELDDDYDDDL